MSESAPKVGIIIGSQRNPRAGPQIAKFVHETIKKSQPEASLSLIDLAEWNLPLTSNEPGIPAYITSTDGYTHDYTKRWSTEISSHSAFIFVTPQYNWGYPAGLKNAIDYLFNEWKGKPCLIVSYGGHGGGKAAAALNDVLQGIRMRPTEKRVALTFGSPEVTMTSAAGKDLELSAEGDGLWSKEREEIVNGYEELLTLLASEQITR